VVDFLVFSKALINLSLDRPAVPHDGPIESICFCFSKSVVFKCIPDDLNISVHHFEVIPSVGGNIRLNSERVNIRAKHKILLFHIFRYFLINIRIVDWSEYLFIFAFFDLLFFLFILQFIPFILQFVFFSDDRC
jgi:hypothetical protein